MTPDRTRVQLLRRPPPAPALALDDAQRRVVAHRRGPLLVLAGPGTGKTTTIVEAVARRLSEAQALTSDEVLVLSFGRAAAADLRSRIASRLEGSPIPLVATFHSFAWQLLRTHGDPDTGPSRLLSGPEQDLAIRDLLAGDRETGSRRWPPALRPALAAGGMARELAALMAAVRGRGLEPGELADFAERGAMADWAAAADFFEEYLTVLDMRGAVDYSEIIHRARALVVDTPELRGRFRAIYVDEYQDTDPAQVALLAALAIPETALIAVGDPDQAIYRFRGADVRGLLNFPGDFANPSGEPAAIEVLGHTRRFGPEIRAVADRWISPVGLGTLPSQIRTSHRGPECSGSQGDVQLLKFDTESGQAAGIADLVRRAHLNTEREGQEPLAWSDIAILVRSAAQDLPRLQRALVAAGVPVEVPASDIPLGRDPALAPLLVGLQLAHRPDLVTSDEVQAFLQSPLVGLHPIDMRRMARSLRIAEKEQAAVAGRAPRPSGELLRGLVTSPGETAGGLAADLAERLDPVLEVLAQLRADAQTSIRDKLWSLWSLNRPGRGTWAGELRRRALTGGSGGRDADRVLDSVVALFNLADRLPSGSGVTDVVASLREQQIPASRPADGSFSRNAVRLLTVHRAKGSEWPMVVLVGMQQDYWPDVRSGSSLLKAERLGADGLEEPRTRRELLDDERRLAFVAATRARSRLVITYVDSSLPEQPQPSVFIDELIGQGETTTDVIALAHGRAGRDRLTAAALTARLRTVLVDPESSSGLRHAAAIRLAKLAGEVGSRGLAPAADPRKWWGVNTLTQAGVALTAQGEPVSLSATAVTTAGECPLRWFLDRRAGAAELRDARLGYGSLLHAVVAGVIDGDVAADPEAMAAVVDRVWDELPFETAWQGIQERELAAEALSRFLLWQENRIGINPQTERPFAFTLGSEAGGVRMRGSIDLVDWDGSGSPRVTDFKTGATVATVAEAEANVQLGVYQLALELDEGVAEPPGGGDLVYLGVPAGKDSPLPKVRSQAPMVDGTALLEQVHAVEDLVRSEAIEARPGTWCRQCSFTRLCPAMADGVAAEVGGGNG